MRDRAACRAVLSLTLVAALGGCAAGSQKAAQLPPVSEVEERAPEGPAAEAPVAAPKPPTVVIIDENPSAGTEKPQTLAEAMRAEKERRAKVQKPVVVLDNQSLAAHGKDQKLTIAEGEGVAASEKSDAAESARQADAAAAAIQNEEYWRSRGLQIRERWRAAADRIAELQTEAEGLRRRFYSADDPYLRDSQIKPEWDRVLAELDDSRREAESSATELEQFLEDGRRAGALPGWLREGTELEPEARPVESPSAEPTEPVEADEPPGDPGR